MSTRYQVTTRRDVEASLRHLCNASGDPYTKACAWSDFVLTFQGNSIHSCRCTLDHQLIQLGFPIPVTHTNRRFGHLPYEMLLSGERHPSTRVQHQCLGLENATPVTIDGMPVDVQSSEQSRDCWKSDEQITVAMTHKFFQPA